ncbi:MAG TPA: hypothetical protein VF412_01650 [Bdellovibrio sp.]|uniref:hypothetical protein n=1 Tax=Bdellovibrio sp. TaxID=28201 RepID=UPI002EE0E7CB
MFAKNISRMFLGALTLASLAACNDSSNSSSSIVSKATVSAAVQNGDVYVNVATSFKSSNVTMVAVQWPVYNPNNPSQQIGAVTVSQGATTTDITLGLDVSAVVHVSGLNPETTLPNGLPFPASGVTAKWYSLPLGNSKTSKLYVNIDTTSSQYVVGYALTSDSLSSGVIANVFFPFTANGVTGYGGIFSGTKPGTSGVAVFADVSSAVKAVTPSFTAAKVAKVKFEDHTPALKKVPVYNRLMKLDAEKATIYLH